MKGSDYMPSIIYTDTMVGANGELVDNTPAGKYASASVATILDAINRGEIECGTGKPYPINTQTSPQEEPPWEQSPPGTPGWNRY